MKNTIQRFREPSTWAGVAALLGLLGLNVEAAQAVAQIGSAGAALLAMFLKERAQ